MALPRQQTLAAMVDWSYDLLTPSEQRLFDRLAVFVGGFTLEAVEAICGDEGQEKDVLGLLLRLVEKSLVVAEPGEGGADRFRLLETLRQYALAKLHARGEVETLSRRHATASLRLAEEAEPGLHGPDQAVWLDRIDREHHNLRAALDWLVTANLRVEALRLAGAINWFWAVRGHYVEGRARLREILDRGDEPFPAAFAARRPGGCLPWRGRTLGPAPRWRSSGRMRRSDYSSIGPRQSFRASR